MIKQMTTSFMLVIVSLVAVPASAITVYTDLDGDMLFDSHGTFSPGEVFNASIYADVDAAHGGLAGFGVSMTFGEPPISVNGVPSQQSNIMIDPTWNFLPLSSVGVGVLTAGGSQFGGSIGIVHLFDVRFQAIAPGTSILTMIDEIPNFGDFAGLDGFEYDDSGELNFLTSEITVVPVPPALMLFGSGMLGLIAFARRRHSRS